MGPILWALAAHAEEGAITLKTSEGAFAVVLPRTDPEYIEIGVYHNRAPLRSDVADWRARGLDHARYLNRGGGTAFIVIKLSDTSLVADLEHHGRSLTVRLTEGRAELHPEREIYPIEALFAGLPRRPAPWPDAALMPLTREGRTFGIAPTEIRLPIEGQGPYLPPEWQSLLGAVEHPSWDDVARWRNAMHDLEDTPSLIALANYRLGTAHRDLGLPREAAYYFRRGTERGYTPTSMFLALADAEIAVGRWDEAREACEQAWYRDASDLSVLVCLGALSLATTDPPPAETGRALLAVASEPPHLLLAGELLLRDGYTEEATEAFARALEHHPGPRVEEIARVALGDAAMIQGDLQTAQQSYLSAPHGELRKIIKVRELALRMASDGVRRWASWVPDLAQLASGKDAAAADALYLLAQVHERYADADAVAEDLARLWDLDPVARQTDIPERFLSACRARIGQLKREGRDAELAQMFDVCWREDIDKYLEDVDMLEAASETWERLGGLDRALEIQQDATTVLAATGREEAMVLARLAHLQTKTGKPELALETIAYAERLPDAEAALPSLRLVQGDAHEALGHVEEAIAAWTSTGGEPWMIEEAALRAGMSYLRHEQCERAVPAMADYLEQKPVPGEPRGELELLLARCEVKLDLPQDAIGHAALALSRAEDQWLISEIQWFAAATAARTGMVLPEDLRNSAPIFENLRAEDDKHARWSEDLAAWRRGQGK